MKKSMTTSRRTYKVAKGVVKTADAMGDVIGVAAELHDIAVLQTIPNFNMSVYRQKLYDVQNSIVPLRLPFSDLEKAYQSTTAFLGDYAVNYNIDLNSVMNHDNVFERAENTLYSEFRLLADEVRKTHIEWMTLLTAATNGKPYPGITAKKLREKAVKLRDEYEIVLSTNVNSVLANAVYDSNLHFFVVIFSVPIQRQEDKMRIFEVNGFPYTYKGTTYIPQPNSKFIALTYKDDYYVELAQDTVTKCVELERCASRNPIYSPRHLSCGSTDYFTAMQLDPAVCQEIDLGKRKATFIQLANQTFFHTDEGVILRLSCGLEIYSSPGSDKTITIQGDGEISIPPMCKAETDGMIIPSDNSISIEWYASASIDTWVQNFEDNSKEIGETLIRKHRARFHQALLWINVPLLLVLMVVGASVTTLVCVYMRAKHFITCWRMVKRMGSHCDCYMNAEQKATMQEIAQRVEVCQQVYPVHPTAEFSQEEIIPLDNTITIRDHVFEPKKKEKCCPKKCI